MNQQIYIQNVRGMHVHHPYMVAKERSKTKTGGIFALKYFPLHLVC